MAARKLSEFIRENIEPLLERWDQFAQEIPAARHMDLTAIRDDARGILTDIADKLDHAYVQPERSTGKETRTAQDTFAQIHGAARREGGFSVGETISEFRALRASVLRSWAECDGTTMQQSIPDITRFNEAIDQALAESLDYYSADLGRYARLFNTLLSSTPDLSFIVGVDGKCIYVNQSFSSLLEISEHEIIGRKFSDIGIPNVALLQGEMQRVIDSKTPHRGEMRFGRFSGSELVFEYSFVPVIHDDGSVEAVVGTARDITERKASEAEVKLAALVYRDSSEGMLVADASNNIVSVNPALEEITGFDANDLIGKNPRVLKSDRHDDTFYKDMWDKIHATGRWKGELWNKKKNGEIFAAQLSINTIKREDGSTDRYVGLLSDVTEKKKSEDLIWTQANFDALTGLPNRRLFRDHLQQEIRKERRAHLPLALMFLDLDGFKDVNDTLGHDMGDVLLKKAAQRLQDCLRESDSVARLGGDEFTVVLSDLHEPGNVDRVARHILKALSEPFQLGEDVAYVSASIGITLYPDDATEIEDLIRNADQAMYAAKEDGKNRYHYFTPAMQKAAITRMHLVNDLRSALEDNQFEVVYQPIVDLASGAICKAEALIRWQHPTRGLVNPIEFISAAEDTGMIASFGDWIFHQAANQVALWREKYHPSFQISLNISPVQFRNEGIDSSVWLCHLKKLGVPGQGIVVEITEGLLLDASSKVTDQLLMLRDAGIEVALDDFGTGYSSLSYLKKFDIDYIKIDQSFVHNLTANSNDMALCEAIIVMAHKLGIKVISEGVETAEQQEWLRGVECDYGQGYFFSQPLSAGEFEKSGGHWQSGS